MRIRDFLTTIEDSTAALRDLCDRSGASRREEGPTDLAVVFTTAHHEPIFDSLGAALLEATGAGSLIGCTAESVVASGREVERRPAMALWIASMPGATITTSHVAHRASPEGLGFVGLPDADALRNPPGRPVGIFLADPFRMPVDDFLSGWNDALPGVPLVGGMASAAARPGENALFHGAQTHRHGGVLAVLSGPVPYRTIVSQGCRPIGPRAVVTRARDNVIEEMAGRPVQTCVDELLASLSEAERERFASAPHLGIAMDERRETFQRGDFLVRNVLGFDRAGALVVNDLVRRGQTVQFQIRDGEAASEDLNTLLQDARGAEGAPASGGLLFTCNGRGTRLFERQDHDVSTVQERMGAIPVAGFFAGGELGPVAGRNFLHGFTASLLLLGGE